MSKDEEDGTRRDANSRFSSWRLSGPMGGILRLLRSLVGTQGELWGLAHHVESPLGIGAVLDID